jgi:hypothetical protein
MPKLTNYGAKPLVCSRGTEEGAPLQSSWRIDWIPAPVATDVAAARAQNAPEHTNAGSSTMAEG